MEKGDLKPLFIFLGVTVALIIGGIFLFSKDAPPKVLDSQSLYNENSHFLGPKDAKIIIVEFSDFECPACAVAEKPMENILSKYKDKIKFVYRHFPLPMHEYSQKAAEAAEAAGSQGKFWEMKKILFANQKNLKAEDLQKYAKDIGLDMEKFNHDLKSGKYQIVVQKDKEDGQKLSLEGTPSFFINGEKFFGMPREDVFQKLIEKNL